MKQLNRAEYQIAEQRILNSVVCHCYTPQTVRGWNPPFSGGQEDSSSSRGTSPEPGLAGRTTAEPGIRDLQRSASLHGEP